MICCTTCVLCIDMGQPVDLKVYTLTGNQIRDLSVVRFMHCQLSYKNPIQALGSLYTFFKVSDSVTARLLCAAHISNYCSLVAPTLLMSPRRSY